MHSLIRACILDSFAFNVDVSFYTPAGQSTEMFVRL